MAPILAIAAGLGLLIIAGVYQLSTARLTGPHVKRTHLVGDEASTFTSLDYEDPTRILRDRAKLLNGGVVLLELTLVVLAVWTATIVYAMPALSTAFKLLVVGVVVVGSLLVGRGLYVRLGLYQPVNLQESFRRTVGASAANDFVAIQSVLDTARADTTLDQATVGLLAGAKHETTMETLREWGRTESVVDPETFEERATALAEAGVIRRADGRVTIDPQLSEADDDQLASIAASVLN